MHRGYIKLWRKSLDSTVWQNPKVWRFWSWCLMKASHKEIIQMVGFQDILLKPGQFIFGRKSCARETKLSEQSIRTVLNHLQNAQKLTIKSTNKFSIISIMNWDTYQPNEKSSNQQVTSKQPASNQQVTTNKNVKNVKNVKNNNITKFSKKCPLPSNFSVTDEMIAYAKKNGANGNLENLTEDFRLYHRKKGSKFVDWGAAWKTWIRNDLKWNPPEKSRTLTPEQLRELNE